MGVGFRSSGLGLCRALQGLGFGLNASAFVSLWHDV